MPINVMKDNNEKEQKRGIFMWVCVCIYNFVTDTIREKFFTTTSISFDIVCVLNTSNFLLMG